MKTTLFGEIKNIIESLGGRDEKLFSICRLLKENVSYYDWVGFYFVDSADNDELVLGPFAGESTEHTRIKFGQGICGQAVQRKETFIVNDVSKEKNYLSCNIKVKSEIVTLIYKNSKIIGELDIDSHTADSFDEEDRIFLEEVCKIISGLF